MGKLRKAEIRWSYPRKIESALVSEICCGSFGIYCISRKFGDKETVLYIGLTYRQNFIHRIKEHEKNWLGKYRGTKYVRFGEFIKPECIYKDTIHDIESCLIYQLSPTHNTQKKRGYMCSNEYILHNSGFRGAIPSIISMKDH